MAPIVPRVVQLLRRLVPPDRRPDLLGREFAAVELHPGAALSAPLGGRPAPALDELGSGGAPFHGVPSGRVRAAGRGARCPAGRSLDSRAKPGTDGCAVRSGGGAGVTNS